MHLTVDRSALRAAIRTSLVTTATFAGLLAITDNDGVALFDAFGALALMVFVQFSGAVRARLTAYVALSLAGFALIAIATLCSRNPVLAAGSMFVFGFAILFSGVLNGYFAAAGVAAILAFVLPVMVPAPPDQIPGRLLGWGVACVFSIAAILLLWPERPRDELRRRAAEALSALASTVAGAGSGRDAAATAVDELGRQFVSTPSRPTGSSGATGALAALVEETGAFGSLVLSPMGDEALHGSRLPASAEAARGATVAALREAAARVERGAPTGFDPDELERARSGVLAEVVERVTGPDAPTGDDLVGLIRTSFGLRALTRAAGHAAEFAVASEGPMSHPGHGWGAFARGEERAAEAALRLLREHLDLRSVCFRNSLRGAVGLAAAVFIAQEADLQHSFWVALGMLSVLRSNALGTGTTVLTALAGVAIGVVAGALVIATAGTGHVGLWFVLPLALVLAAYAPRAISFLWGQAAFTLAILILFDLIDPVGWKVGLIRIEDVAIGAAISVGAGILFWPHGAAGVIRSSLGAAYTAAADHAAAAFRFLYQPSAGPPSPAVAHAAAASSERLDSAMRQFLAERSAETIGLERLAKLAGGISRLRLATQAALFAARANTELPDLPPSELLTQDTDSVSGWYRAFGESLADGDAPAPSAPDLHPVVAMAGTVAEAARSGERDRTIAAVTRAWGACHLAELVRLEARVAEAAPRA